MNKLVRRTWIGAVAFASILSVPMVCAADSDVQAVRSISYAVFRNILAPCGGGFVLAPRQDGATIILIKDVKVSSTSDRLSDADRRAGIEWQGEFALRARFYKLFVQTNQPVSDNQPPHGDWGIWRENIMKLPVAGYALRKVRGRWEIAFAGGDRDFAPLDAANFPLWRMSCRDPENPVILPR